MRLALPGEPHLTYCTNIHPGETWPEIEASLAEYLPAVKARISLNAPMGVGLRLSGVAAASLAEHAVLDRFKRFLAAHDLYVFTVNAFPYGPFHGQTVKARVYAPDWRTEERLRFTNQCADILAGLLPEGHAGSVSTVPGAFKSDIRSEVDVARMAEMMVRHAAHLQRIAARSGKIITLALEPEPCCFIETTGEAIDFFRTHLFGADAVTLMAALTGLSPGAARASLKRHLGLCFDVCHAAVEFEDVGACLARIEVAGIGVAKVQLSSAIRVAEAGPATEALLAPFDDGIYLHQTVAAKDGKIMRHADLPQAFAALRRDGAGGEWRVHCHVPVFLAGFGELGSTQEVLKDVLRLCREKSVSPHLEVETYTWSVLPSALRGGDLVADIAREMTWVRAELRA